MAFGKKDRKDWNAQDNAAHAMSAMLGAEIRNKRIADAERNGRVAAVVIGLVIAGVYLALHFSLGW